MASYVSEYTGDQIEQSVGIGQDIADVNGILKCDGDGNISGATSGTDYAPAYTYGTTELTPGTSALATGTLYIVYEA